MNKELNLSYEILSKVIIDKSYVSIELNKYLSKSNDLNSALVTKIVYGVLEKDIMLDYFVAGLMKKLPEQRILILLKIVAYVSKFISSIPPFALVNEIVNIAKKINFHKSGFVNAVSKNIISSDIKLPNKKNFEKYLSVKYNYPEWVIKELLKTHDKQFVLDLLSNELSNQTHIRINLDRITAKDFIDLLNKNEISFTPSLYEYTMYVDYAKLLKFSEFTPLYIVQGLPSIITCNVIGVKSGKLLDVCSAPGGKSVYLAQNKNLEVYATDLHEHRINLVKKYAEKVGVKVRTCVYDGTKLNEKWIQQFDYVMCDVPCSNLGVSRKKPDVFLNKSYEDTLTLAGIQYEILNNASNYVKSGGILQYSTCTILDKENKDVITKFLEKHKDFELTPIDFGNINIYNDNNMYTFYPHLTKTEGFFIGRLQRK